MKRSKWNIKEILITLAIILVIILLVVLLAKGISSLSKNSNSKEKKKASEETTKIEQKEKLTYKDYENKIKIAAERYQNDNYQGDLESKETWVLSYKLLRENDYLKEKLADLEDKDIECNGYVVFEKDIAKITYTPYIKCGKNYKTSGYDSSKINE